MEGGESGFCNVRYNKNNKMFTLTYGKLSHLESRPIEIKPFYHFKPGSTSMTFSTYSCNFECPWCQNWRISRTVPPQSHPITPPEKVVEEALLNKDESVCASLNEPTLLFEYLLDVFKLAKRSGLYNTMVSNGYMTVMALRELRKAGLDAINIDIKGNDKTYNEFCNAKLEFVWRTVREAIKMGVHVEIVCLLVTDVVTDDIASIIENHLKFAGCEIPIHFTRYFPAFLFDKPPTRIEVLESAVNMATREGICFAYIGNVPGHRYENTYCPECGELLIKRYSYRVLSNRVDNGKCYRCKREIYGVW